MQQGLEPCGMRGGRRSVHRIVSPFCWKDGKRDCGEWLTAHRLLFHLQIERFQDFFLSNPKKQLLCPSFLATRPPADRAESIFLNVTWIAAGGHGPGVLNPP